MPKLHRSIHLLQINVTFTGILTQSGTINANNINATGTISGATITGDVRAIHNINGTNCSFLQLKFLVLVSRAYSAYFERTTGTFIDVTNTLSGATITGNYGQFLNLTGYTANANSFSGTTITGDTANLGATYGTSGSFTYLSGTTVTGTSGLFTAIDVQTLNAANLQF